MGWDLRSCWMGDYHLWRSSDLCLKIQWLSKKRVKMRFSNCIDTHETAQWPTVSQISSWVRPQFRRSWSWLWDLCWSRWRRQLKRRNSVRPIWIRFLRTLGHWTSTLFWGTWVQIHSSSHGSLSFKEVYSYMWVGSCVSEGSSRWGDEEGCIWSF